MNVEQETLGFRRGGLSPPLSLLMSAFALPIPPAWFTPHLRRPTERSPTISAFLLIHAQVAARSPSGERRDKPSIEVKGSPGCFVRGVLQRYAPRNCFACPKRNADIPSFGAQFEPRYIFRAGRLDQ